MLPSLAQIPNTPNTGVAISSELNPLDTYWTVTAQSNFLAEVVVAYKFTMGGMWPGVLNHFTLDFKKPGVISLTLSFVGADLSVEKGTQVFELYDSQYPFSVSVLQTVGHVVQDRQRNNGHAMQEGLEVFQDGNMTQIVAAAKLIIMQRAILAVGGYGTMPM